MTKREIAFLSVKLTAVYLIAKTIVFSRISYSITTLRSSDTGATFNSPYALSYIISWVLQVAVLSLLILKSDFVAARLIKDDKDPDISLNKNEVMTIAICCIGLSILIYTLPHLTSALILYFPYTAQSMPGCDSMRSCLSRTQVSSLVVVFLKFFMGVYLFLKPEKLAVLLRKKNGS